MLYYHIENRGRPGASTDQETQFMTQALQGIKVLDFSMGVAGPHAGMLCAQHGADVVKVETREGDWCRVLGQQYGDLSAFSLIYNRGKRSLAIDMKQPEALRTVQQMATQADVIIEAFRPGVMKKFGLDFATVRRDNPNVVYLSVSGFGADGPMADAPATDAVMQAFSGLMNSNKDAEGTPQRIDLILIDVITGLYGYQAISSALIDRLRHGTPGRHIDCSLLKAAVSFQAGKIVENYIEKGDRALYVPLGVFATADGHITLSCRRDEHFEALCRAIDAEGLLRDGRYATGALRVERQGELLPLLKAALQKFTTDELSPRLSAAGILYSRINTYEQMLAEKQVAHAGAVQWQLQHGIEQMLPIADIPGVAARPETSQAPHIGQHSKDVLQSWGVAADTIADLVRRNAINGDDGGRPAGAKPR
jgi:crotonobetainyl-CoA:carnitine CoA-transferase CaiB-like acyl-CoA transferase